LILIITGTQNFQFNRLIKEMDLINMSKKLPYEVFAQIGTSTYTPKSFKYIKFVTRTHLTDLINNAKIIISHGGSASIITALKLNKKIISVPRLKKYNEHVDDHQLELVDKLKQNGLIEVIITENDISDAINKIEGLHFKKYTSNNSNLIKSISADIDVVEFIKRK